MTTEKREPNHDDQVAAHAIAAYRERERKQAQENIEFGRSQYSEECVRGMRIMAELMGLGEPDHE